MTLSEYEYLDGYKLRRKVRAIIANDTGEFLFIQPHGYKADTWTFVGGGIEPGESEEQAILREIREETGLTSLIDLHISSVKHHFVFSDRAKSRRHLDYDGQAANVFFATVSSDSDVDIQVEEIQAYRWCSLSAAEPLLKIQPQKKLFNQVLLEFQDHPSIKKARLKGLR